MSSKILIILIFLGITMFPLAVYANSGELSQAKNDVQQAALRLASCSGVYAAVSKVHAATKAPVLAKTIKERSNGAWLASAYLLFSSGIIMDWKKAMAYAENTALSEQTSYMATFEKYADPNKGLDELLVAFKECNKFGEVQAKLVQEARLKFYARKK